MSGGNVPAAGARLFKPLPSHTFKTEEYLEREVVSSTPKHGYDVWNNVRMEFRRDNSKYRNTSSKATDDSRHRHAHFHRKSYQLNIMRYFGCFLLALNHLENFGFVFEHHLASNFIIH